MVLASHLLTAGDALKAQQVLSESHQLYDREPTPIALQCMLAECAIALVDFDKADRLLVQAAASDGDADIKARICWLRGEIAFLQRNFLLALDHYSPATGLTTPSHWQCLCCLQMAKCHERLGQIVEALTAYRRVVQSYPEHPAALLANQRLETIANWQTNTPSQADAGRLSQNPNTLKLSK
jgi:tetratricopeptide (TPR) repeat protein